MSNTLSVCGPGVGKSSLKSPPLRFPAPRSVHRFESAAPSPEPPSAWVFRSNTVTQANGIERLQVADAHASLRPGAPWTGLHDYRAIFPVTAHAKHARCMQDARRSWASCVVAASHDPADASIRVRGEAWRRHPCSALRKSGQRRSDVRCALWRPSMVFGRWKRKQPYELARSGQETQAPLQMAVRRIEPGKRPEGARLPEAARRQRARADDP